MDIQILRDGQPTGPYSEDDVHGLLKEGRALINDLAWRPGLADWVPLVNVLYPAATQASAPPAPAEIEAPAPREPATARQKAFLDYVGIACPPDATKDDASLLVSNAMEHPKDPARLARWNEERLHLHADLFADEIQARKENRPQRFLEICHEEGALFFEKVTKAHCQVLVAHLDVHSPSWDANERAAVGNHFFPALAEKFPQLLTEEGKVRFKPAVKTTAGTRQPKSSPVAMKARPTPGPNIGKVLYAIMRGVFVGLMILGLLWIGRGAFASKTPPAKKSAPSAAVSPETPAAEIPAAPVTEEKIAKTATTENSPEPPTVSTPAPAPASAEPAMAATETKMPAASPDLPAASNAPATAPAPALIPPSAARTSVILTKAVQIPLPPYGKISVPAGTSVKIVSQNGSILTVRYLDHVITVPASSTDLGPDPAVAPPQ